MTKTTRPRAVNLYTVTADGAPVAQAEAISQAEAVALWVASQQQPTLSARLATPRESRDLAHLPLLTRGAAPERDPRVPDMFDDVPADPVLVATYCPPVDLTVKTYPPEVLAQFGADLGADHVEDVLTMVEEPAAVPPGEPAGCLDAAPTAVESDGAPSAVDDDGGELKRQAEAATARAGGKIVAKYRDPATGQTWSGRGLRPRWLVDAIEDGRALDEFLIENQGAQA